MKTFLEWLNESKGIILSDDIKSQINTSMNSIIAAATALKEPHSYLPKQQDGTYPTWLYVAIIKFRDYHTNAERSLKVYVVNDPNSNGAGNYQVLNNRGNLEEIIKINVANIDKISPMTMERLVAHELIHAVDIKQQPEFLQKQNRLGDYIDSKDNEINYATQADEFDAYIGQIVYSITQSAEKFKGTDREQALRKYLNDTLNFITNPEKSMAEKKYGFVGPSDQQNQQIYQLYLKNGSEQQKRKMKQRIYNAVVQAQKILG
jgi:hypothetical protein